MRIIPDVFGRETAEIDERGAAIDGEGEDLLRLASKKTQRLEFPRSDDSHTLFSCSPVLDDFHVMKPPQFLYAYSTGFKIA